jgi:hypothetical protein
MTAETGSSPAADPGEQSSRVPRWLLVLAGLALAGVVGVIVYRYLARPGWVGVADKTLWDWLQLLSALAIPVVLALGGYLFTRSENRRAQAIANQRAETERQIADQRRQDDMLQAYLDQIGQLLLDKDRPLRESKEHDEVRTLARARTLTVLEMLDGKRKGTVLQFLQEARLIRKEGLIIDLRGASLRGTSIRYANLRDAYLRNVDLSGASLRNANLEGADLQSTSLINANLSGAVLFESNLTDADLVGANLHAAFLYGADLRRAGLGLGNLRNADLRNANLDGASVTDEELAACKSLEGATMPIGYTYEDWLETFDGQNWLEAHRKGRREDGENSGPS